MLYSEISFLMQVLCGLNQLLFPFRGWALLCSWQFTGMEACPLFVFQVPGAAGLNQDIFCFVRTYRTVSANKLLWEEVEGLGLFSCPHPLDVDHILPLSTGCLLSECFQNPSAKTSKLDVHRLHPSELWINVIYMYTSPFEKAALQFNSDWCN